MPNKQEQDKQRVIFVINPISGGNDKSTLANEIKRYALQENFVAQIYYTTGKDDEINLREIINSLPPDKVVAVGGDGTCNLVGRLLLNTPIKMGIVPVGSANGLAKELGIPSEINESLHAALYGVSKPIDAIRINDHYISLHLSDMGVNAHIVKRFEIEKVRGFWGYGKHLVKELMSAKLLRFKIILEERILKKSAFMLVLANASQYGTGAVINPTGKIDDGFFEIILVRPYSIWHLLGMIIPFYTKTIHQLNYIDVYKCKRVVIVMPKRKIIQIDGEVIGRMNEIKAQIIKDALHVMVP